MNGDNIEYKIKNCLLDSLVGLGVNNPKVELARPELVFGDYTVNSAMVYAKELGKNPREFAEIFVKGLCQLEGVVNVDIAGPGFINISLSKEAVRKEITRINDIKYFETKYSGKKVLIEHSSPNLFKPFHIGHLMNNTIGEAIVRMTRSGGGEVAAMSFPSDVSLGIAKAVYWIDRNGGLKKMWQDGDDKNIIAYLGEAYVKGIKFYEDNIEEQEKIKELADKIYNFEDIQTYNSAKEININYFLKIVAELGTHFDKLIYESEAGLVGLRIVSENTTENGKKVFTKSQGAIVYIPDEARKDINTTVFINSQGNPTYSAKDIGLIDLKFKNFNPHTSVYVTDNEQIPHFRTVFAAAEQIDEAWKDRVSKSLHVPHGRMTFKGAKMSSRLGGVPLAEDIIQVVMDEVRERSGERVAGLSVEDKESLFKDIALAAIKFSILRSKPGQNINFDPETSLSFEGDSGPYVQYTHARCCSLIAKSGGILPNQDTVLPITDTERKLAQFEDVSKNAINEFAPQYIVTYLFELCQIFNSYYAQNHILVEGDSVGTAHRLWIVEQAKSVIARGLEMLAVGAPEQM